MSENIIGRIYDIQGFSVHDGPGIRTTIFTKGCPLRCLWCHSPESQRHPYELSCLNIKCVGVELCGGLCLKACANGAIRALEAEQPALGETVITRIGIDRSKCVNCLKCAEACPSKALVPSGYESSVDEIYARVEKDRIFFKKEGGVTLSGGEPMSQFEFTYNLAMKFHENGIGVCLDTTGFAPAEQYLRILPYVSLFLYDLKHMDSRRHEKLTAVPNGRILSNAKLIAANGGKLQIRVPVIPKLNADRENLARTADFCAELGEAVKRVQLLPYHAMGKSKYERLGWTYKLQNVNPPGDEFMAETLELFESRRLPAIIH
jgi:pyruvate formate lyase activating enzyme